MPGRLEGPAAKRGASGSLSPKWDGPRLVELGNNWTVDNASVLFFWRGFSFASKTASSLFLSSLRLMGPFPKFALAEDEAPSTTKLSMTSLEVVKETMSGITGQILSTSNEGTGWAETLTVS